MSGRGTPRFPPVEGLPVFEGFTGFTGSTVYPVPPGPWGISYQIGDSLVLTNQYVRYQAGSNTVLPVPYGAVKVGLNCLYTPAEAGGRVALQAVWVADPGLSHVLDANGGSPTIAPPADPNVSEISLYQSSIVTPASSGTTPFRFVVPISVPSITPLVLGPANPLDLTTKYLSLQVYAREAGGGANGTFTISELVAESFGNSQVVSIR